MSGGLTQLRIRKIPSRYINEEMNFHICIDICIYIYTHTHINVYTYVIVTVLFLLLPLSPVSSPLSLPLPGYLVIKYHNYIVIVIIVSTPAMRPKPVGNPIARPKHARSAEGAPAPGSPPDFVPPEVEVAARASDALTKGMSGKVQTHTQRHMNVCIYVYIYMSTCLYI